FLIARTDEQNLIECAELRIPARQQLTRRCHLGSLLLQAKKRVGMRSGTNRDDGDVIGHRGFSSRVATAAFARSAAALRRRATCAAHRHSADISSYCDRTSGQKANAQQPGPQWRPRQRCCQKSRAREDKLTKPSAMMAAALAAAAALISIPPAQAAGTVKIGILWPLTGNAAAAGQALKAAAEVAAEIVNNKHPELGNLPLAATEGLPNQGGAKLELTFVDHQGNPSLAQQLATRLITQDAVHVLMGAYQSSC